MVRLAPLDTNPVFQSLGDFFFLYWLPSWSLCMVFDSISCNINELLLISPSVFVFGDFNIHHKDWVTYSGGTDQPGELCYNFSTSNDLTQMVNFPTQIPDCDSHSPALFWIYFFPLVLVFILHCLSLCWETLMLLPQFPLTFHQIHNEMPHFIT